MSHGTHPHELMMVTKSATCFQRSSHHERTQYTQSTQPTESTQSTESTVTVEPEHDDHHGHDRRAGHAAASRARTEELMCQDCGGSGATGPRKPQTPEPDGKGTTMSDESNGWQPIETAPKDGTTIVGYPSGDGPRRMRFIESRWEDSETVGASPTHWRLEQAEDAEMVAVITRIVREADVLFQKSGGSSRHWVRDCFLPLLNEEGLFVMQAAEPAANESRNDDER